MSGGSFNNLHARCPMFNEDEIKEKIFEMAQFLSSFQCNSLVEFNQFGIVAQETEQITVIFDEIDEAFEKLHQKWSKLEKVWKTAEYFDSNDCDKDELVAAVDQFVSSINTD